MHIYAFLTRIQLIYSVHGLSFKTPVNTVKLDSGVSISAQSLKQDQKPINLGELRGTDGSTWLPVTVGLSNCIPGSQLVNAPPLMCAKKNLTHELGYFINIGIGSPPQYFSVLLDISAADTFISSIRCKSCSSKREAFSGYNSTASLTYHPNNTSIRIDYGTVVTTGILSQDKFHLGDLDIEDQLFQEALIVNSAGPSWDDISIVHGVLGLTPSSVGSAQQIFNPFINAVS